MRLKSVMVGLIGLVAVLGACGGSPGPPGHENASSLSASAASAQATSGQTSLFQQASPVPDARINFTVTATREPNAPPCCDLSIENTENMTLYGFTCHLVVYDMNGDVLYRGPVEPETPGLTAPPGRSDGGFYAIGVRDPAQIGSSEGVCDAWVWPGEPPP